MKKVQYHGDTHYRIIEAKDWKSLGIENQGKVIWDRDNRGGDDVHPKSADLAQVHELADEAADWLLKNEPKGHFKIVDKSSADSSADAEDVPPDEPLIPPATVPTTGRAR